MLNLCPLAVAGIDDLIIGVIISLVIAAASMVISEALRPKPKLENARPASLGDFHFPTAEEGRVIPIAWGRVRIDGANVVWYGDFRQVARSKGIRTGLWSTGKIILGYRYYVGFQMALCLGPVDSLKKIWVDNKVIFDEDGGQSLGWLTVPRLFGGEEFGGGGISGGVTFYPGNGAVHPNPQDTYLYRFQTPLPGYKGVAYFVWEGGWIGNSTSLAPWAFEVNARTAWASRMAAIASAMEMRT